MKNNNTVYIENQEIGNVVTHGIGACLAITGLVILVLMAYWKGTSTDILSFTVFGSMMVILYMASTIYHSLKDKKLKSLFRKLDHMSIYLFIAGTYTPFCFALLSGPTRWFMLGAVWACALLGAIMKVFYTGKKELLSTILYISMGWIGMIFIDTLYSMMSLQGFIFLLAGGLFYTVGTFFYMKNKIRYNHVIWHLFVLGGSAFHYFSVLSLLQT
ncbi:hemolysin III family protein [Fulvivirga sp. 29W222]|uniref:Hemolysin III family protein n=1 Tax=Fulvivirga marina TaxID=2494733 RepID=A0A937KBI0_9BACT|nr:hemolysin III family protein [Fulvivirga marina]MBL6446029.1 hemolysin III family protein [Fulvivirga marina]